MASAEAYPHAKFHLDSSNRLATVHQRFRQDRQTDRQTGQTDRQRSDSIWRTVLQTVAQKLASHAAKSFQLLVCWTPESRPPDAQHIPKWLGYFPQIYGVCMDKTLI